MIVADATPVLHLARAGILELLPKLYACVLVPSSVWEEVLGRGEPRPEAPVLQEASEAWIEVRSLSARERRISEAFRRAAPVGRGEADALALAESLKVAVLMDDRVAVDLARMRGVETRWTTSVVLEAHRRGILDRSAAPGRRRPHRLGLVASPGRAPSHPGDPPGSVRAEDSIGVAPLADCPGASAGLRRTGFRKGSYVEGHPGAGENLGSNATPSRAGTMKAFVQDRYGPPDVLQLREIDKPILDDDRVLVKVRAASVNAFDWHILTADFGVVRLSEGLRRPKVSVRGADVSGTVEAVGKGVTRFHPGDDVFGQGRGSFAEYTTARERSLVAKPRNVSFEQAAAVPGAGYTALQGLRDKAQLRAGQRILIYGAGGGVGTLAVQIAKALGAHVTAASRPENVDMLRSIGADEVIDYTREDFATRGPQYDVFFDIGASRPLSACRKVLTKEGTYILCGAGRHPIARLLGASLLSKVVSQRLRGFLAKPSAADLVVLKEFLESGKLRPVIDRQYPFHQTPEAVRHLGTGKARGKIIVTVP